MITDSAPPTLRVDVLGPLRLAVDGAPVDVPGERRRALLALLALSGGRAVGIDRLIDALWPDDPPDGAVQALCNHLSRLRRHLGSAADRLQRYGAGYALHLEPDELMSRSSDGWPARSRQRRTNRSRWWPWPGPPWPCGAGRRSRSSQKSLPLRSSRSRWPSCTCTCTTRWWRPGSAPGIAVSPRRRRWLP